MHPEVRGRTHVGVYAPGLAGVDVWVRARGTALPLLRTGRTPGTARPGCCCPAPGVGARPRGARSSASKQGAGPCSSVSSAGCAASVHAPVITGAAALSSWDVHEQRRALSQGTQPIKPATAPGRLQGRQGKEPGRCLRPQVGSAAPGAAPEPGCAKGEASAGHGPCGHFFTGQG